LEMKASFRVPNAWGGKRRGLYGQVGQGKGKTKRWYAETADPLDSTEDGKKKLNLRTKRKLRGGGGANRRM